MVRLIRSAISHRCYYGWAIVVACFILSMIVFGTTYAFSVFYDAFIEEFDVSRTLLAVVFGLQSALIYVVGVFAGRLIERHGQRIILFLSSVLMVAGLIWSAFARSYLELLVSFGVLTSVGMGGLYVIGYATVPLWFSRRRGAAAGIASSGLGLGLAFVPPGANFMIGAVGWRIAILVLAGVTAGSLFVALVLFVDRPEDVGASLEIEFGTVQRSEPSTHTSADGQPGGSMEIINSRPFRLVFFGWVLIFTSMFVVMSHIVLYAADVGIGREVGVIAVIVIGVSTTGTRVGIGFFADRVGRSRTFIFCAGLMGASMGGFAAWPTPALFLAVAFVFGIAYGGCGGLIGPVVADLFGQENLNTLFSVMSVSFAVAGLFAPPIAGGIFEIMDTYIPAFVLFGSLSIIGAVCVLTASRSQLTSTNK